MKRPILSVLLLILACNVLSATSSTVPESCEYKILLKTGNYTYTTNECGLFWELVEKVAADNGFIARRKAKSSSEREIRFIDSAAFDLNKKGFLLRIRTDKNRSEMTLKFRSTDIESAISAPVEPANEYGDDVSLETDLTVKAAMPVHVFSRSGRIDNIEQVPDTIGALREYYPGLARTGLNDDLKLINVNNVSVIEQRLLHGTVDFGFDKVRTLFSIWHIKGESQPMAAEFSFKIKTDKYLKSGNHSAQQQIDTFFADLVKRGKLFINSQQTKTGMVYQYQTED
jgi:hypothetical protein